MVSLTFYYSELNKSLSIFFIIFFSVKTLIFLIVNFHSGLSCLPSYFHDLRRDYFSSDALLRFGIVYLLIPPFMCSYSSMKQAIPVFKTFDSDRMLSKLDYLIHFNHNPWDLLQAWLGHPELTRFIDLGYATWGAIFLYTMLWMACTRRKALRLQFLLSLSLCWILIGNVAATLLASVGPCYYAHVIPDSAETYSTMLAYLRTIPDLQATRVQDTLWDAYSIGKLMPLGGISAMPSMHVSIAVLLALVYSQLHTWTGLPFILYAILIQVGSVHLGWHYAVDGYVSIVLTLAIWSIVKCFLNGQKTSIKEE
ncbi:MAG: hypothetical protein BA869_02810 [Desulfuromonadales bacterium C00003107]|nr:MAG: hypothetical protein BA869_02810 [Desulfuromonadales bacterium C00003107]